MLSANCHDRAAFEFIAGSLQHSADQFSLRGRIAQSLGAKVYKGWPGQICLCQQARKIRVERHQDAMSIHGSL
jgi:hypothetical protein